MYETVRIMKDASIAFRIPADVKAELQRRADADERSLSQVVLMALRHYIDTVDAPEVKREAKRKARG